MEKFSFRGKKVLVAGGTGLIGIPLVKILIEEEGAEVHIVSLDDPSRAHPEAEFWRLDLLEPANCLDICEGMDYVFNLLCIKGSPKVARENAETMLRVNLLLDINLLHAARLAAVQGYLLASSLAVYTPAPVFYEDTVWQYGHPNEPSQNDYYAGWAKRIGELQIQACRVEHGWDKISIVRPTNTYGPGDEFNPSSSMVVPSLIKTVVDGTNPMQMRGDGSEIRDFLYAEDAARGMILVAKLGEQRPVNLGSGTGVTIRDLLNVIMQKAEMHPKVIWDISKKAGDLVRVLDIERAHALGFQPKVSLPEGVAKTIEWYKVHKEEKTRFDFFSAF